jgi:hypothetical protein
VTTEMLSRLGKRIADVPVIDGELRLTSRRAFLRFLVVACFAAMIILSTNREGIRLGMDHALAYGTEIDAIPISIALSESVYGVDLGYVGLLPVYSELMRKLTAGSSGANDETVLRNIRNQDVINGAITAAASLEAQSVGFVSERVLLTTMYLDQGSVDYMKLAFHLFGYRIQALYHTYFLLIATSTLLFLLTFPNAFGAQMVLISVLFALRLELFTPIFSSHMPTFAGMRHSSTLCLIPVWHFVLLSVSDRRVSWISLLLAVAQLAILVLAITVRGTAIWAVVFLTLLAVVCGTASWFRLPPEQRTSPQLLKRISSWPVVVLLVALAIYGQYVRMKLHPVYFTDDMLPHHPVWHSAYVGLKYSPELYGFPVLQEKLGTDALAFDGALDYLNSTHFIRKQEKLSAYDTLKASGYFSDWNGGNPKWRLHDEIMRRVVFQIARAHPSKMLYMYAIKKPLAVWAVCIDLVRRAEHGFRWWLLAAGAATGMLWIAFASFEEMLESAWFVPIGGAAAVMALLPCLWAYPEPWSVTDGLLLILGTIVLSVGLFIALSVHFIRRFTPWPNAT